MRLGVRAEQQVVRGKGDTQFERFNELSRRNQLALIGRSWLATQFYAIRAQDTRLFDHVGDEHGARLQLVHVLRYRNVDRSLCTNAH